MVALARLARGSFGTLVSFLVVACGAEPSRWLETSAFNRVEAAPRAGEWPDSTAGAYLAGRFALDRGDVATAAEQLQYALRADPGNAELSRQLFAVRIANGTVDAGVAARLLAHDPAADEARLVLALTAFQERRWSAAREELDRIGQRGIATILVPTLTAWTLVGEGRSVEALALLGAERREDGFAALRTYHRAVIQALAGDTAAARMTLAGLVDDDGPSPVRVVLTMARVTAEGGDRATARALLQRQSGYFEDSVALEDAIALLDQGGLPALPIRDPVTGAADALLSLAAALQEQGLNAQALLYGRLATHLDPAAGDAWLVVARAFQGQGNAEEAARLLDRVPERSPYRWNARLARAEALDELGRTAEAVTLLRDLAGERRDRLDALVALGDLYRSDESYAEAAAAYGEAIARVPPGTTPQWRLLYVRGIAYERTKRWPEAEADFLKALELEPEQPFVLNYLGYSWVDQGKNLDRAKAMLHRAVELRPEDGFIVDSLGWAYYRLGDYAKAVDHLERAVELQPGDPVINDHLGDAYWRVGREREARFQWKRALSLEPEADTIAGIEGKIERGLEAAPPSRG
jgi:tetratricopeptide (TPR) repeat protein